MIKQNVLSFLKFVKNNFFHLVYFYLIYLIIVVYIGQAKVLPCYYGPQNVWLTCSLDGVRDVGWKVVLFNNPILTLIYVISYNVFLPLSLSFFTIVKTTNTKLNWSAYVKYSVLGICIGYLNSFINQLLNKFLSSGSILDSLRITISYFSIRQGIPISACFVIGIIWSKLYQERKLLFPTLIIILFILVIIWEVYLATVAPVAVGQ